jgi:hypothetical protein
MSFFQFGSVLSIVVREEREREKERKRKRERKKKKERKNDSFRHLQFTDDSMKNENHKSDKLRKKVVHVTYKKT